MTEAEDKPLTVTKLRKLIALFPEKNAGTTGKPQGCAEIIARYRKLSVGLQDLASSYLRSRTQPTPSHAEANYELHMIAHLAWKLEQSGPDESIVGQLQNLINNPNGQSDVRLWSALRKRPGFSDSAVDYLQSPNVDWRLIGDAAADACAFNRKGDSTDVNVGVAVKLAVDLFVLVTGLEPTWSGKPTGAATTKGNQTMLADSPCGRFMLAFFAIVDPDLPQTLPSNFLRRYLPYRRKLLESRKK